MYKSKLTLFYIYTGKGVSYVTPYNQARHYTDFWMTVCDQSALVFNVRACGNASVILNNMPGITQGKAYEILLNYKTSSMELLNGINGESVAYGETTNLLSCYVLHTMWLSWQDGLITAGLGPLPGLSRLITWQDPTPFDVNGFSLAFQDSDNLLTSTWQFNVFTGTCNHFSFVCQNSSPFSFHLKCSKISHYFISLSGNKYHFATPDEYTYQRATISPKRNNFLFSVQACNDAHVTLSTNVGDTNSLTYEVVIGGFENTRSVLRDGVQVFYFENS